MAKKKKQTVPVSERALIQRINRKLPEYHQLKKCRGQRWVNNLGSYYVLDGYTNAVEDTHIDLEYYGRKLGALSEFEHLENSKG